MRNNDLRKCGEKVIRVLEEKDGRAFIVDCTRKAIPKWVSCEAISDFEPCTDKITKNSQKNSILSQFFKNR